MNMTFLLFLNFSQTIPAGDRSRTCPLKPYWFPSSFSLLPFCLFVFPDKIYDLFLDIKRDYYRIWRGDKAKRPGQLLINLVKDAAAMGELQGWGRLHVDRLASGR